MLLFEELTAGGLNERKGGKEIIEISKSREKKEQGGKGAMEAGGRVKSGGSKRGRVSQSYPHLSIINLFLDTAPLSIPVWVRGNNTLLVTTPCWLVFTLPLYHTPPPFLRVFLCLPRIKHFAAFMQITL